MRKVSVLMAFLVTGYVLGIWNFLVMPKYYLVFGMKGLLISLIPALGALFLMYSEAETTKRTRYLIYELFFKVTRKPAVVFTLLMFLLIMLGVTTYFTAYSVPYILGFTPSAPYVVLFSLLTVLLVVVLLILAKGKTLDVISFVSILFIAFAVVTPFVMKGQVQGAVTSESAQIYMEDALSAITSFDHSLNFSGVIFLLVSVIISFGLGAGVYYVIGSFSPGDLDFKTVFGVVVILQIVLGFAAAYTVAYSLGASYQALEKATVALTPDATKALFYFQKFDELKQYTSNATVTPMESVGVLYSIPEVIKDNIPGYSGITTLLMLSLYFAGLSTIIVLVEMGAQIFLEVLQVDRGKALLTVSAVGFVISAFMVVQGIKTLFVAVPFSVGALIAALEAYPLLNEELTVNKPLTVAVVGIFALIGLGALYYSFVQGGSMVKLGLVLGLVLFVPLLMNGMLLKARR